MSQSYDFEKFSQFSRILSSYNNIGKAKTEYVLIMLWDDLDHELTEIDANRDLLVNLKRLLVSLGGRNNAEKGKANKHLVKKIMDYTGMDERHCASVVTVTINGIIRANFKDRLYNELYELLVSVPVPPVTNLQLFVDGHDASNLLSGIAFAAGDVVTLTISGKSFNIGLERDLLLHVVS